MNQDEARAREVAGSHIEVEGEHMGLTWTTEKPTVAGWYWWRKQEQSDGEMCRVHRGFKYLRADFFLSNAISTHSIDSLDGQWAGPITPPKE